MSTYTEERLIKLTKAMHNRKPSPRSKTGHLNIHPHKKGGYEVTVAGTYIGYTKDLDEAIAMRDEARGRLLEYWNGDV